MDDRCVREAILWSSTESGAVRCALCAHRCLIAEGKRGICGVRQNNGGVLETLVYGRLVSAGVDPIEKKPLYHFLPGSASYSIATAGCNMRCAHCQNYSISQVGEGTPPGSFEESRWVVSQALEAGARSISYTYTEPTIFLEYALDVMALARERGLYNIFVSNGYMTEEALDRTEGLLDAVNVDVKAFEDSFYKKICGARLGPVLETVRRLWERGVWVEVTTLVIPGYNDSERELTALAEFLASVSTDIVWHVTGFYPTHRLRDAPPTSSATLEHARELGMAAGLKYVYTGNRPGAGGESTYCPGCGEMVICRSGFALLENTLEDGACPGCGCSIAGRFGTF